MNVLKKVYMGIVSSQNMVPPESGGIIGSKDGIVTVYVNDKGVQNETIMCGYFPDVNFLNEIILEWQNNGIKFMGIYHTHFFGVNTLSDGDKEYIQNIMKSMPKGMILYFPIVLMPEKTIVS